MLNVPESVIVQLDALNATYTAALEQKNYLLCDLLRIELQRVLTGQKLLIPVESGLDLLSPRSKNSLQQDTPKIN